MDGKHKPTKSDLKRQKEIEKRIKAEGLELGHPQGKERFESVLRDGTINKRKHK